MRKICLLGASLETSNMGVSALAVSFFNLITASSGDANPELCLLVGRRTPGFQEIVLGDRKIRVKLVNYRISPRARLQENLFWILLMAAAFRIIPSHGLRSRILKANEWLRCIQESGFIGSIHGGDGFSDIYGLAGFILRVLPDISILLMGKELVLLPQTYGPYTHPIARGIARLIMKRASKLMSRDKEGLQFVRKMLGAFAFRKPIIFCPDIAFVLDPVFPEDPKITPPVNKTEDIPLIGINVNGLMYHGGFTRGNMFGLRLDYPRFLRRIIKEFLQTTRADILLVPHTYAFPGSVESDPDACCSIQKSFSDNYPDRVHVVSEKYDQSEIKGIISRCDFFIGSRMHACIGALSQGIPTIGVAYSPKFIGVFQSMGMSDTVIDARMLDEESAVKSVFEHWVDHERICKELKTRSVELKKEVWSCFNQLVRQEKL